MFNLQGKPRYYWKPSFEICSAAYRSCSASKDFSRCESFDPGRVSKMWMREISSISRSLRLLSRPAPVALDYLQLHPRTAFKKVQRRKWRTICPLPESFVRGHARQSFAWAQCLPDVSHSGRKHQQNACAEQPRAKPSQDRRTVRAALPYGPTLGGSRHGCEILCVKFVVSKLCALGHARHVQLLNAPSPRPSPAVTNELVPRESGRKDARAVLSRLALLVPFLGALPLREILLELR